jgi:Domain of unknown function (DUF4159)
MSGLTRKRSTLAMTALAVVLIFALGSDSWSSGTEDADTGIAPRWEFSFVRLAYTAHSSSWGRSERWLTDYPEADAFLVGGVRRMTRVNTRPEGIQLAIMDDALFDYPWIYAVEVGGWSLSDEEAARLREYLLRGGFLVVDDFHGTVEWAVFEEGMRKIFPDRSIVEIPRSDPVFHMVYDIDDEMQIPGVQFVRSGRTYEKDGYKPHWRGIYDDQGRLMVVINFNMDLGDSWEHADYPPYPWSYTNRGFMYGVNYIVYAMTH